MLMSCRRCCFHIWAAMQRCLRFWRDARLICMCWWVRIAMFWVAMLVSPLGAVVVLCEHASTEVRIEAPWHTRTRKSAKIRRHQARQEWKAYSRWLEPLRYCSRTYRRVHIRLVLVADVVMRERSPPLFCWYGDSRKHYGDSR